MITNEKFSAALDPFTPPPAVRDWLLQTNQEKPDFAQALGAVYVNAAWEHRPMEAAGMFTIHMGMEALKLNANIDVKVETNHEGHYYTFKATIRAIKRKSKKS